jgi:aminopeptidase N
VVKADLQVTTNPASPLLSRDLVLDGDATSVTLHSVSLDNVPLAPSQYTLSNDKLIIPSSLFLTNAANAGTKQTFTLSTVASIVPEDNTQLSGFYKSNTMYCSQCEAEGFRRITYFPDRPDNMATFSSVTITADKNKYPVLLSNGNLISKSSPSSDSDSSTRHSATWSDPFPKPAYLFAIVVGDLKSISSSYKTMSGRDVHLEIFSEPANVNKLDYAMDSLKKSMLWDEEKYGLEYDLDIFNVVAVNDFNMGAMENKGLNVFNTAYVLADQKTASDTDYARVEGVIGHEYFHNWTGNRVTCRDWFQLTLKEGLTVFRDQQFSGDMNSNSVQRIQDVAGLRGAQFREDGGPMSHPIRPESYIAMDNFYTSTVYSKGAEVIRMYHTLLGADGFRKGMDLYFERHDGSAVTCDDFRAAMSDANGRDLTQFERWYTQSGTPTVSYTSSYDPTTSSFSVTFSQSTPTQPSNEPFHIPISFGIIDSGTGTELLTTRIIELTKETASFNFPLPPSSLSGKPIPSILRGFSAPVKLVNNNADENQEETLSTLAAYDTDGFNRWESGQKLFSAFIFKHFDAADSDTCSSDESLSNVFKSFSQVLSSDTGDNAIKAYSLALPSEAALSEEMTVIDPTKLRQARGALKKKLAAKFALPLKQIYEKLTEEVESAEFKVDSESVGRRMLRNVCLDYICSSKDGASAELAHEHYHKANCMTDRLAALTTLCGFEDASDGAATRDAVLADFLREADGDALVVNKWFTCQATSSKKDVLGDVKTLTAHPEFTLKNPNRVRSLVSAFTTNLAAFHRPDGEGYAFVADMVKQLDKINPQVASRLVGSLITFKRYDENRATLMKNELEGISKEEGLSNDVFEIVGKALK